MTQKTTESKLTWDSIADYIVGKDRCEAIGTGATLIGTGLTIKGIVTGDTGDIIDGAIVGGAGILARVGRPIYRGVQAWRAARAEKTVTPNIDPKAAEEQLSMVENATCTNATAEVLKKSAIELGLDDVRWIQLQAKAQRGPGHMNKPEAQLFNAVVKHAELACARA
jgi:hypothetical protein